MRKLVAVLCGTALIGLAGQAVAQGTAPKDDKMMAKDKMMEKDKMMAMDMKAMDTNHDGMVTKEEFMAFHEAMWNKMKRNDKGMVMMRDVEMMYAPGTVGSAIPGEPAKKATP